MKVQSIHVTNFKRFYDLTIDLGNSPKRIVALIGPNGCGKSSVFDAFIKKQSSCLSRLSADKSFYLQTEVADSIYWYDNQIDVKFENNQTWDKVVRNSYNIENKRPVFIFRSSYRYNTNVQIKAIQAISSIAIDPKSVPSSSAADERLEFNYRHLLSLHSNLCRKENLRPTDADQRIFGELNEILNTCLGLKIVNLGNVTEDKGCLFLTKPDYPKGREFSQNVLSAGEKEVLDLLLDLYLRKEICTDHIYLIDEPELHINTSIQRNLLKAIVDLVPPNNQIWIATHSIGIMRSLQTDFANDCQIIEFMPDTNWASSKVTLTPKTPSFRDWQRLFTTPLADLTHLTLPNKVILCEGWLYDYQVDTQEGLDGQVFNNIFGESHPDTVFVSIGGCADIDKYHSDLQKLLSQILQNYNDVSLLSLIDRDDNFDIDSNEVQHCDSLSNGLDKKGEDRVRSFLDTLNKLSESGLQDKDNLNEFTRILNRINTTVNKTVQNYTSLNRKMLDRRELENYLCDPEVLQDFVSGKAISFNREKYDDLMIKYLDGKNSSSLAPIFRAQIKSNMAEIFSECFEITESNPASTDDEQTCTIALLKELKEQVAAKGKEELKKWEHWNQLKLLLSKHIKQGMKVYDELEQCIFDKNKEG